MINEYGEPGNNAFPNFYFGGPNSKIYHRLTRIIVSACCFVICILFFIPLFNLFRMQLSTALEKRQIRIDEEEYEKTQLKEKLDEEVWEDLEFEVDTDNNEENDIKNGIELNSNHVNVLGLGEDL